MCPSSFLGITFCVFFVRGMHGQSRSVALATVTWAGGSLPRQTTFDPASSGVSSVRPSSTQLKRSRKSDSNLSLPFILHSLMVHHVTMLRHLIDVNARWYLCTITYFTTMLTFTYQYTCRESKLHLMCRCLWFISDAFCYLSTLFCSFIIKLSCSYSPHKGDNCTIFKNAMSDTLEK